MFDFHHPLITPLAAKLFVALRRNESTAANVLISQIAQKAKHHNLMNGCGVGDILADAVSFVETSAAIDRDVSDILADAVSFVETSAASPESGSLQTVCAADITMKPVEWLWHQRIAIGKVTVLAGEPGLGKSQVAGAAIPAIVTAGLCWPLSDQRCTPGDVLIVSGEDDAEDTIVPRAAAAGADLRRLHVVQAVYDEAPDGKVRRRALNLVDDPVAIEAKLLQLQNPRLVVLDPISAFMGRADSHNNAEVRALLAPLAEIAARRGVAFLCVSHLNKTTGQKAMNRVIGSVAQVAAARAAYLVARESDGSPRRFIVPLKNNLGIDHGGFSYEIEPVGLPGNISTSRIKWASTGVDVTADQLLSVESQPATGTALDEACTFLAAVLEHGEVAHKHIEQAAARAGVAWRTVERASKALDIHKRKERGKAGRWLWSISAQSELES